MAIYLKYCQKLLHLQKRMEHKTLITPRMCEVVDYLIDSFVGMSHCVTDNGRNLIVEVPKSMCEQVRIVLKQKFEDVALMRNAYLMIDDLHDFILVKPLVSEAPLCDEDGIMVPALEKMLVDYGADKEYASLTEEEIQKEYQRAFELYSVNKSRLLRYAGRKGEKEETLKRVNQINQERVKIIHHIQDFFLNEPVKKAWLFGSFSRMEERPDSDIDILVDIDRTSRIGLLQYAGMANELERILGRKVDLVAEGSVKPFAKDSINHDKVLIYERA